MSPEYREIPVDLIRLSPFNTRGEVPADELEQLAATMRESHGNDVPIKVRPVEGAQPYELVYGERRLRALRVAGLEYARCVVQEMTDAEVLMEQWVENEEHRDIPDYGKALKLKQIMETEHLSQVDLAKRVKRSPPWITKHLQLLKLEQNFPGEILWKLTEKQASAILSAPEELLSELCALIERINKQEKRIPSASEIAVFIDDLKYEHEQAEQAAQTPHQHVADESGAKCKICGRPLSDPESVKREMGPVCASGGAASPPSAEKPPAPAQLGPTPKPLTLEERAYALLDAETAKWGPLTDTHMIDQLKKLGIYLPESRVLAKKYMQRAKTPEPKQETEEKDLDKIASEPVEVTVDLAVINGDGSPGPVESYTITIPSGGKLEIRVDGDLVDTQTPFEEGD